MVKEDEYQKAFKPFTIICECGSKNVELKTHINYGGVFGDIEYAVISCTECGRETEEI